MLYLPSSSMLNDGFPGGPKLAYMDGQAPKASAKFDAEAKRLKAAIEHAGMTLTDARKLLQQKLGISNAAIGMALAGETRLIAENMARAAKALGVSFYWLATGEGEMVEHSLSPEAMRIAQRLDKLKRTDPKRYGVAMAMCELAAWGHVPEPEALPVPAQKKVAGG